MISGADREGIIRRSIHSPTLSFERGLLRSAPDPLPEASWSWGCGWLRDIIWLCEGIAKIGRGSLRSAPDLLPGVDRY